MPDPFEEFEQWTEDRLVSALPADEVRRRGDRMRRRRTGLQAFGAAAALAVVVAGGSLLTAQSTDSGPRPAPATEAPRPSGDWLRDIPTGFPLDEGMQAVHGRDAERRTVDDPSPHWTDLLGCRPVEGAERLDARIAFATAVRVRGSRELALFADEATAQAQLQALRDAAVGCADRSFLGSSTVGRFGVRTLDTPLGEQVLVQMLSYDGQQRVPGRRATVLSQAGNAVLMVGLRDRSTALEPTDDTGRRLLARAQSLAAAMCVFTAVGCPAPAPDDPPSPTAPSGGHPTTVPAGIRLDPGLFPLDADSERTTVRDRSTQLALDPCHNEGGRLTGPDRTDFVGVVQTFPAGAQVRQLAVYPDSATAAEAISTLESELELCRSYQHPDGLSEDRWTELGSDAATLDVDDALLAVDHAYTDGNLTTLATHHLVVRVGNAVLAMAYDGEFGASQNDEAVFTVDAKQRDDATRIIPQLCVFADGGCP